jgi:hypothetical protein
MGLTIHPFIHSSRRRESARGRSSESWRGGGGLESEPTHTHTSFWRPPVPPRSHLAQCDLTVCPQDSLSLFIYIINVRLNPQSQFLFRSDVYLRAAGSCGPAPFLLRLILPPHPPSTPRLSLSLLSWSQHGKLLDADSRLGPDEFETLMRHQVPALHAPGP